MAGARMRRVDEAVREVVAATVVEVADPRLGFVTVTGVETSADLRSAKVFVSVLGDLTERDDTLEALCLLPRCDPGPDRRPRCG